MAGNQARPHPGCLAWGRIIPGLTGAVGRRLTPLVVMILTLSLTGCRTLGLPSLVKQPEATSTSNQFLERSVQGDRVVSKILPVRLRLRPGWQEAPANSLHDRADLQVYHPGQQIYLVVLGESKATVPAGTLEQQASRYLALLESGLTAPVSTPARTGVSQIANFPAVQYELQGQVLGQEVSYLHTTLEVGDHYYQVVIWTAKNKAVANREEMGKIVQGFDSDQ
ncbi:MAG: hypothetical protein ACKO21_14645 [Nodosilinea sp.]